MDNLLTASRRRLRLLVLGIGNLLYTDDGVGVHVVRELRKRRYASILVTEIGTAMLDALPLFEWADRVLVVDAIQAGGKPGSIYWGELSAIRPRALSHSIHDADIASVLGLMSPHRARPDVFVLGIEPASLELGLDLTATVRSVVSHAIGIIDNTLGGWRAETALRRSRVAISPARLQSVAAKSRLTTIV